MSIFKLINTSNYARAGVIHTAHGDIATPCFMPVGTQATVKTLDSLDLEKLNAPIILGNTYHLHLRPGEDLIDTAGGLHKFMNWKRPILTDSGGFQVFSLGLQKETKLSFRTERSEREKSLSNERPDRDPSLDARDDNKPNNQGHLVKIDDDGVTFRSHIDGSTHRFTPESAIEIQHKLGADIIMAFDECTPDRASPGYARQAMGRTHLWAERCITEHKKETNRHGYPQFLFGIIQGAKHQDLREESAKFICSQDFDGIAVGGESIGYNMEATDEILKWVYPHLPADKPHYAMGMGLDPADLLVAVENGIDMFDCVAPTRLARHGMVFTKTKDKTCKHRMNIKNSSFTTDFSPIENGCTCHTCQNYTRAYLHHLFAAEEMTAMRLTSIHNLHFMINLMKDAREAILNNSFAELKNKF